jgi:hypothetical protein
LTNQQWASLSADDIRDRFGSAAARLEDLLALRALGEAAPRLSGADSKVRQRLSQEFFFHLLGAVDALAQVVNERRSLGLDADHITIRGVCTSGRLPSDDMLRQALGGLCQQTKRVELTADPYSEDGLIFRAMLYRHSVTHRHINPFVFRVGSEPPASLLLDPRKRPAHDNFSSLPADQDLHLMLTAISSRCAETLNAMGLPADVSPQRP